MSDPVHRYVYERAERLGMTVGRMIAEMSSAELTEWMSLDSLRAEERAKEERMARMRMKSQGLR